MDPRMRLRPTFHIGRMERVSPPIPYSPSYNPLVELDSRQHAVSGTVASMLRLIRFALQLVLFFLLLSAAVALGAPEVGVLEKLAVAALAVLLVWLAGRVRRLGLPA
jgi:hypothetical protein